MADLEGDIADPLSFRQRRFRGIHLSEDAPFKYVVILGNELPNPKEENSYRGTAATVVEMQQEVVRNITRAGLDVTVMQSTEETKDVVVLLVNASRKRLLSAWKRLVAERSSFNDVAAMLTLEKVFEDEEADADDIADQIRADRPAWHRNDETKGKLNDDDYDATKWENERDLSYADEILCIHRILSSPLNPQMGSDEVLAAAKEAESEKDPLAMFRGAAIDIHREPKNRSYPIVQEMFPLHDDKFVNEFCNMMTPKEEFKTLSLLGENWFAEELRYHFGERIAYYFAFQQHYTAWLKPVSIIGLLFYVVFSMFGSSSIIYWRIIAIYGFLITSVWVPAMLKYWLQRTHELNTRWGLANWNSEDMDPNPNFDWGENKENSVMITQVVDTFDAQHTFFFHAESGTTRMPFENFQKLCDSMPGLETVDTEPKQKDKFAELDLDKDGYIEVDEFMSWINSDPVINAELGLRPQNPPFKRYLRLPANLIVLALFTILFFILNLGFVYWYVYGVLIDVCGPDDERSWPGCFGTREGPLFSGRWAYLALQGIALGIFLDEILEGVVTAIVDRHSTQENLTTLKAKEDYYVSYVFGYLWMGWFMWFAMLAFVYIPFGHWIQESQQAILGEDWVNDWEPGLIAMDTALVTPLIVTQLLKIILDTFIPYLVRRLREKTKFQLTGPLGLGKPLSEANLSDYREFLIETEREPAEGSSLLVQAENTTSGLLDSLVSDSTLADKVYVTESIPTWQYNSTTQKNERAWKTASHIVNESKCGDFNFFSEMLRPVIQCSYVTNFSAVWPLAALCAYLNNIFEVKGDAFKLLTGQRRPVPRKVDGIGSWNNCLFFVAIAGIFFTVGMIVIASNGLEAFILPVECDLHDEYWIMTPNIGCFNDGGVTRTAAALFLEHLSLFILFVVYSSIPANSGSVKELKTREMMKRRKDFEDHWVLKYSNAADVADL